MQRREFLTLSLGVAGLTAFTGTPAFANPKTFRLVRPAQFDLHYINVAYPAGVERKYKYGYPWIARIEFRVRGRLITTLTTAPYNFTWVPVQADWGESTFTAQAFSASGNLAWSKSVMIQVTNLPSGISAS